MLIPNSLPFPFGNSKFLLEVCDCLQFSSVTQSCLTLWDPMDRSMPSFPVLHYLLKVIQ